MKISSRSILSPGRVISGRDPQPISLSASVSRRLRTSRSIKGATSPGMFPMITNGKKRGCGFDNPEPTSPKVTCIGQVRVKNKKKHSKNRKSFSKLEHSCSQRVDANNHNNQKWVHIPLTICETLRTLGSEVSCLFPCRSSSSSSNEKEEKTGNRQGTCAVFARWLVAMNEENGNGNCNGDGDDDDGGLRRHVFEDLEIVNDSVIGSKDEARVSLCVPPKNALLLMRCRSDPTRIEALANRFSGPNLGQNLVLDEIIDEEKQSICEEKQSIEEEEEESMFIWSLFEEIEDLDEEFEEEDEQLAMADGLEDENFQEIETGESNIEKVKEGIETRESNMEKVKQEVEHMVGEVEKELPKCLLLMMYEPKLSMEVSKETWVCSSDFIRRNSGRKTVKSNDGQHESKVETFMTKEHENDLIRMGVVQYESELHQPARSSCSFPTQRSMATVLEQKLVNKMSCEPLMLKRCKSEPMRNEPANLVAEACLWRNKLEPPRRASFGVGTDGLRF